MKTVTTALYIIFIILLLGVAGLFLSSLLPIPGNIQIKIVKSGSMEPAIATGSVVMVKPQSTYAIGDIITFGEDTRARIPTTHRIIAIHNDSGKITFTVKGDANAEEDPASVQMHSVIGRVILSVPYIGYVLDFARQPIGFTLLIGIPACIIIFDEALRIWTEVRGMRQKKRPRDNHIIDLRNAQQL